MQQVMQESGNAVEIKAPSADRPAVASLAAAHQGRMTQAYQALFDELRGDRYHVMTVAELYAERQGRTSEDKVTVVLRIDVDNGLHLVPALSDVLAQRSLPATFFFLTDPDLHYDVFGSGIPSWVAGQGHEVGLHYDHLYRELLGHGDALDLLRQDLACLQEAAGVPVRGATYHGHPEINALGHQNIELAARPGFADLGLDYHDGPGGGYVRTTSSRRWPRCHHRVTDFFGYPGSFGFNYDPTHPLKILRKARPGEVVHVAMHAKNAFRYWDAWDTSFGESPLPREPRSVFLWKKMRIRRKSRRRTSWKLKGKEAVAIVLGWTLANVVSLLWIGRRTPPVRREWDAERQRLYDVGLDHWQRLLDHLHVRPDGGRFLEVGAGNGQWLAAAAMTSDHVHGVEPSDTFRVYAHDTLTGRYPELAKNIRLRRGSAEFLPYPDDHFDQVLCAGVFMFTQQEWALEEMTRVLKPGGRLALTANGIGYFWKCIRWGTRYGDRAQATHGVRGLLNTWIKHRFGSDDIPTTAVNLAEMEHRFSKAGLTLERSELFLTHDLYPAEIMGMVTNYAFLATKPEAPSRPDDA